MLKIIIRVGGWNIQLIRVEGWIEKKNMKNDENKSDQGRRMDRKNQRSSSQGRILDPPKKVQSQAPLFRISKP